MFKFNLVIENIFFFEYINLFVYLFFLFLISLVIFFFSFFLIKKKKYIDKSLPYECGFNPFISSRKKFNINYYIIGILFIIFDIEISFLFPWVLTINDLWTFFFMFIFLILLFLGFIYEWKKGALNWK